MLPKIVVALVVLVFLAVGGVFALILLGSDSDEASDGPQQLAVARGPATVQLSVDGESSSWETEGPGCTVLEDESSYLVALPGVGVSFSLQVGTPEVDDPLATLRSGEEVAAGFSGSFSGVSFLVEEADGAVQVADDLRSGEFEGTTTDDRQVTGSYTC